MGFSLYRKNTWLGDLSQGIFLSLHYADPDIAGAYASEIFGGSYVRVPVEFTDPSSGAMFNTGAVKFSGLPSVALTHFGGWDAKTNGNLEFSGPLVGEGTPIRILAGGSYTILGSAIGLSIS